MPEGERDTAPPQAMEEVDSEEQREKLHSETKMRELQQSTAPPSDSFSVEYAVHLVKEELKREREEEEERAPPQTAPDIEEALQFSNLQSFITISTSSSPKTAPP